MKLDKRSTSVIGIAVIIGLLVAGWFLIVSPSIAKQNDLNTELADTQDKIEQHKGKITQLEQIKANISEYESQDKELSEKFPDSANIKLLLGDITKAGERAGVSKILDVETGTPEIQADENPEGGEAAPAEEAPADGTEGAEGNSGNLAIMPLTLTAEGSEASLSKYSTELTKMDRSFLIQESSIDCSDKCTLNITGTTYLYRPTTLPGADNPEQEAPEQEDSTTTDEG